MCIHLCPFKCILLNEWGKESVGGGGGLEFTLSLKFEFLSKYIQCNYSIHCWNL